MSIIVSSSFLHATYGKALRSYLSQNTAILRIVDFGGLAIFENAKDTYVCIPLFSRTKPNQQIEVSKVTTVQNVDLQRSVSENSYVIPTSQLTSEAWYLENATRLNLFQKIMSVGISLGKYSNNQIFYGIKTGLNQAFIIDTPTKERLITQDLKNSEIIKPLLQGEDIRRWGINSKNLWLIFTRRGIEIDAYPAIKAYLSHWKDDLTPKLDKNKNVGVNLAVISGTKFKMMWLTYQGFDGLKIIYPDIAKGPRFYLDGGGHYPANTAYALVSPLLTWNSEQQTILVCD